MGALSTRSAEGADFRGGKPWRLLPNLNAMHEGYDFAWEPERRVAGNLDVEASDVMCVILPERNEEELTQALLKRGMRAVGPRGGGPHLPRAPERRSRERRATEPAGGLP